MRKIKTSQLRKVLKKVDKKTLNKRTLVKNEEALHEVTPEKQVAIYNHEKGGLAKFARDYYIDRLGLEIEKGTIVGLTGETGAGKSTLFHIILGLLKPQSGTIFFKNEDINFTIATTINDKIGRKTNKS